MNPHRNTESHAGGPCPAPEDSLFTKDKARYRVSPDYVLREVAGEYVMIPIGEGCKISNALMAPNETAVFLFKAFAQPACRAEVLQRALGEYDAPADVLCRSIDRFIAETVAYGVLEEVE